MPFDAAPAPHKASEIKHLYGREAMERSDVESALAGYFYSICNGFQVFAWQRKVPTLITI